MEQGYEIEQKLPGVLEALRNELNLGLNPTGAALPPDVIVIRDLHRAKVLSRAGAEMSEEEFNRYSFSESPTTIWADHSSRLGGKQSARIAALTGHRHRFSSKLDEAAEPLAAEFHDALQRINLWEFEDSWMREFARIAIAHRLLGDSGGLGEQIIQTLGAGAVPCGYEGRPPTGSMIVYWPHDVEPPGGLPPAPGSVAAGPSPR